MYLECLTLINNNLIYNVHQFNMIQLDLTLSIINYNSLKIYNKIQIQNFVLYFVASELILMYNNKYLLS